MIIRLTEIPERGLEIKESRSLDWLREQMQSEGFDVMWPASNIELDLKLIRHKRQVRLTGKMRLQAAYLCSKCGKQFEREIKIALQELFLPSDSFGDPGVRTLDLQEEDFQNSLYSEDEINLGRYLAESVLLEMQDYPRCEAPECNTENPVTYGEDWDVDERELRRNPDWQRQLQRVNLKMNGKN